MISISIEDVIKYNYRMSRRRAYDDEAIYALLNDIICGYNNDSFSAYNSVEDMVEITARQLFRMTHMPLHLCKQAVMEYLKTGKTRSIGDKGNYKNIEKLCESVDRNINQRIIYLTTYRRIKMTLLT